MGYVDCFDVVDDTPVDVVSAGDDENDVVVVVVVFVIDGVVWVVEGSMSPLKVRLSTIFETTLLETRCMDMYMARKFK